jgi:recombination protein RecT
MSDPNTNNTPVAAESANPTVRVQQMLQGFMQKRTLHLPADYSAENALKQAWLVLQTVNDRNGKPALQACTQASIINALLDMAIQGLNPAKKQCYFIAYGQSLVCQRSYFGDIALAQRVMPGIEPYYGVIYEGDTFEIEIIRGRKHVSHKTSLDNQGKEINGAYCGVVTADGEDLGCEVMTFAQIQQSWGMSKTYNPKGDKGTHHEFPDQMSLRTVIRRRLKPIISSANDALLMDSIKRQEMDQAEAEMAGEIAECGNGDIITVQAEPEALPTSTIAAQLSEEPKGEPVAAAPADEGGAPY